MKRNRLRNVCSFFLISNNVLMPIGAFCTCIFVGYFIKPKTLIDEIEVSGKFSGKKLFTVMIKYVAPICIVLILASSVLEAFGYNLVEIIKGIFVK